MLQLAENCQQCTSLNSSGNKIEHPECIKHDLELVYGKVLISAFQCCNLLKTVYSVCITSRINIAKTFFYPECFKHYLELVYGKVLISVFQCCNLLKIVHSVPII